MIVASPKSVTELKQLIDRHQKVLFVGCGTCVTVCLAGGEREVGIADCGVRMARKLAKRPGGARHLIAFCDNPEGEEVNAGVT